jgi:hypothetical protein
MEFKINKRTRIKIKIDKLVQIRKEKDYEFFHQFLIDFGKETGLTRTSVCYKNGTRVSYFKIVDAQKYFLAKIKYGI